MFHSGSTSRRYELGLPEDWHIIENWYSMSDPEFEIYKIPEPSYTIKNPAYPCLKITDPPQTTRSGILSLQTAKN